MRRVVVTGLGIVSSIGNNQEEVLRSLKEGRSGIVFCEEYKELGFRSQVHGSIDLDPAGHIDRKILRFMGNGAARSEEHTSELQSLMRISYAVFCLKKINQ